jgi:hypothetical protein
MLHRHTPGSCCNCALRAAELARAFNLIDEMYAERFEPALPHYLCLIRVQCAQSEHGRARAWTCVCARARMHVQVCVRARMCVGVRTHVRVCVCVQACRAKAQSVHVPKIVAQIEAKGLPWAADAQLVNAVRRMHALTHPRARHTHCCSHSLNARTRAREHARTHARRINTRARTQVLWTCNYAGDYARGIDVATRLLDKVRRRAN